MPESPASIQRLFVPGEPRSEKVVIAPAFAVVPTASSVMPTAGFIVAVVLRARGVVFTAASVWPKWSPASEVPGTASVAVPDEYE
ncbi:hypothetical protein [Streptomyces mirabilis]|uniref:hypothetical protein n=1 Tax=Streptomyces mirabilis TaxID=68239 RepID=UPI0036E10152